MKTLLVTAFLAVAIGACSSDSSSALDNDASGTVQQGGACSTSADCEPNGGLVCAFPVNDAGSTCPTTGLCVSLGPFSVEQVCPCGGSVLEEAYVTATYSTVAPGGTKCPASTADSGTTTTTTTTTDAGGGTTSTPTDSGSTSTPTDAGGGAKSGG